MEDKKICYNPKYEIKKNILEIFYDIELIEPLNIGKSKEDDKDKKDNINRFLKLKEENSELLIPGSSIRGVIKNMYDYISQHFEDDEDVLFGNMERKTRIFVEDIIYSGKVDEITAFTNMRGKSPNIIKIEVIPKISIITGGRIVIRNVNYKELYKILMAFRISYEDEIRIGSNKSRGFGLVRLNIKKINLEMKDDNNTLLDNEIKKFFKINEEKSIKIGNKFLKELLELRKEYSNFEFSRNNEVEIKRNKFLLHVKERAFNDGNT
ncbi:RAMP superfamily CRISPR-associated protein [Oceanivirga salmonicida]|uniref:RAMP superfamily CRISPR-associated protein n=1 Tax=Oceanivirga salmonicida TaxID=1769291 RepID=UPI0012E1BA3D|nr:RAMP superfamily CRISPR-associated protein [Oceanivirga salmonicida]